MLRLEQRALREVNTDPQRRCYNGCHFSSEFRWTEWEWLEWDVPEDRVEARLTFWRDLNAFAVRERGKGATKEFRVREVSDDEVAAARMAFRGKVPCPGKS